MRTIYRSYLELTCIEISPAATLPRRVLPREATRNLFLKLQQVEKSE